MKIHQLPTGARFVYEGEEYVKTGPMVATGKVGQRMIPKFAVLKPLVDVAAEPVTTPSETLPRTVVLEAFEAFHAQCATLVPEARLRELEAARDAFLKRLP